MKTTFAFLAALILPSVALAEHYICTRVFEPFIGQMVHIVIIDNFHNILMKESKNFASANHFTIKNGRGRFDMTKLGNQWSALFDDQDWGTFNFQETWTGSSMDTFRTGCYDVAYSQYYDLAQILKPLGRYGQITRIFIMSRLNTMSALLDKLRFRSRTSERSDTATETPYVNFDQLTRHAEGLDIDANAPYIHTMQNLDRTIPSNMGQFSLLKKCMTLDP
ncbi:hypothetical protein EC957_007129 [Mortierella hygrophila]|uniref:Uncharacterized protein n=1 Tax=Mortierella hygrophila TaxID=979708 RepID=A0A9P6EYS4_9FUNG|nr:hypothetical protein EC957_007129 [Mortierella hygrophila]